MYKNIKEKRNIIFLLLPISQAYSSSSVPNTHHN